MKPLTRPFVVGTLIVASMAAVTTGLAAGPAAQVFPGFLQVRNLVAEMQSKVPLRQEWSLVYCECKNARVVAIPLQGTATEIDRALCEQKSRDHGGCKTEVRVMKVGPSEKRLEAYRIREQDAKRLRALQQEQERLWRAQQQEQQSPTPGSAGSRPSADTQWMSKEDYERHNAQLAEEEYQAERQARKRRVDKLRDDAKEVIYRSILGR